MPQLDPYWVLSQAFWLLLSFITLYVVLTKKGLPRLDSLISSRKNKMAEDLQVAEDARKQSEAIEQQNQAQIKSARARASEIVSEILKESDALAAQRHADLDKVLQRKMAEAQTAIDKAKREVMERVIPVSADLTEAVLKKVANLNVPRGTIEEIVATRGKHV